MTDTQCPMPNNRRLAKPATRPLGFTLIEMVVAVSLITLLVGIAVPVVGASLRITEENTTRERMEALAEGIRNFYEDTETFPATLSDLVSISGSISGWAGPYVNQGFDDAKGNIFYDSWRNLIQYIDVDAATKRLRSRGLNATDEGGGGDDIDLDVDATALLRKKNQKLLDEINAAITTYNVTLRITNLPPMAATGVNPPHDPSGHQHTHTYIFDGNWVSVTHRHQLSITHSVRDFYAPADWPRVAWVNTVYDVPLKGSWSYTLSLLELRGLLDNTDGRYTTDAWGNDFVTGTDPVQYVTSGGSN